MNFSKKHMDGWFYRRPGFYLFFIPIKVPYKAIYAEAQAKGLKLKETAGPILEKGALCGRGWIGVEIEETKDHREDVFRFIGDFEVYRHQGPYKTLGQACQKIRKVKPATKEMYNLYLDDPIKTKPKDCRTDILFR